VIGLAFGGMRSARRGIGSDVAGSRPYRPGDDVDTIDWAASAKLSAARGEDEFIVREDFADESPRVVVLCDRRPTLAVAPPPAGRLRKAVVLEWALALISRSAVAARSLVGYLDLAGGVPFWRPPRTEHRAEPGTIAGREFRAPVDTVSQGLEFLGEHRRDLPTQAFVFVLSDFIVPPDLAVWQRALENRWELVPVIVQDPLWERTFPDVSGISVPYADPTSGHVVPVYVSRREAAALKREHEERWRRLIDDFRSLGIEAVAVHSHDVGDMLDAFLRWADLRLMWRGAIA
jgi:uncharacterized protein (DUF58 family)